MARIALSAPWFTLYHEMVEMFKPDKDVLVMTDEEAHKIKVYVANGSKYLALDRLLKHEHDYGNVKVTVDVIPANCAGAQCVDASFTDVWDEAFSGNPMMVEARNCITPFGTVNYVIFMKTVVQFFNDDISDVHGNCTTLLENIAEDIFEHPFGENFCTDIAEPKPFTAPLGEWP